MVVAKNDLGVGEFAKFLITPQKSPHKVFIFLRKTPGVQIFPLRTLAEGFLGSRRIQPYLPEAFVN